MEWKTSSIRKDQTICQMYPMKVFMMVDGSYSSIDEPSLDSVTGLLDWNDNHSCHAFCWFLLTDPRGHIVFSSTVDEGSVGDKVAWENHHMCEVLKENFPTSYFSSEPLIPAICGDKAFPRIKVPEWFHVYTTRLKGSKADLKDIRCVIDPGFAPHRTRMVAKD